MSSIENPEEKLYSVPVPAEDIDAIYKFLADRAEQRKRGMLVNDEPGSSIVPTDDLSVRTADKNIAWDDFYLSKLIDSNAASVNVLVKILDVLAQGDLEQKFTRPQLIAATGVPSGSFNAAFTKWSAHFRKHYDGIETWPILGQVGESGQFFYWVTPEVRGRWRKLRSADA